MSTCSRHRCDRPAHARGLCQRHYHQAWRNGVLPINVNGRTIEPCGTYGGYQHHKKAGETPCEDCRLANAEYQATYRAANTEYARTNRAQTAALARAKTRVAQAHPDELQRAYDEELQRHEQEASTP